MTAHNFSKIQSLISYNCLHHFNIIFLPETYLNSELSSDNESLDIPDYRLVWFDHPSHDKRVGVCVYFKSSLQIQILSTSMLHELEIIINGKLCKLVFLHRSPSQNMKEFERWIWELKILSWILNLFLTRVHISPYFLVTVMLNHITGIKVIRPQLPGRNLRYDFSLWTYSNN